MAQHGYLHDEYDRSDFDRSDDDREGGSMFGGWNDRDRHSSNRQPSERHRDDDRGFFHRAGGEVKSWFGDDDHDHRGDRQSSGRSQWQDRPRQSGGWSGQQRDYGSGQQGNYGGGREHSAFSSQSGQSGQRYSAHPDDHYRSWRDKQMQALDRDYQDYCREREQQFHSEFDTWRQNRQTQGQHSSSQGSQPSSDQNELSNSAMELNQQASRGGEMESATASPMGAATMGTNNSENTASAPGATGRSKS